MSTDVLSSPYPESLLNEGWAKQQDGLSAIAEFNAAFDGGSMGIDPRMTLSNPPSPNIVSLNDYTTLTSNGIDQTISPEPDLHSLEFCTQSGPTSPAPYFNSIESIPSYPSPLRHHYANIHRRSISQPPESLHQPPVVFHRSGHYLGHPTKSQPYSQALKSTPRGKQSRHQPYPPTTRGGQSRYQLRRAQTQLTKAPTSAPMGSPMPLEPLLEGVRGHESPLVASNSEEAAQPARMTISNDIDPLLIHNPSTPGTPKKVLSLPLTVKELQELIREAVESAVSGLKNGTPAVCVQTLEASPVIASVEEEHETV